ncbi:MAG TPA: divalent-cation tolerance protein CutA [Nitrospiria bacterium]
MAGELVVLITTKNLSEARRISRALVEEKLAACVNVVPTVESVFTWQGRMVREKEALMVVKTRSAIFSRLEKKVKQLHSYTVPEIIALPIKKGSRDYLAWVRQSTR